MGIAIPTFMGIALTNYGIGIVSFAVAAGLLWYGLQFSKRFSPAARQNAAASLGGLALIASVAGMILGLLLWAKVL